MTDYNTIAETKHFIVLDRYERDMVLNEEYQSEDALEREFMTRGKKHIVAMTGSYFRGDTEAVLHPEDEAKFESVTYTYYEQLQQDLDSGFRKTLKYQDNGEIKKGDFFIVEGQKAYVADWGERFISSYNKPDRRLRVIYDNGTESDPQNRHHQRLSEKACRQCRARSHLPTRSG